MLLFFVLPFALYVPSHHLPLQVLLQQLLNFYHLVFLYYLRHDPFQPQVYRKHYNDLVSFEHLYQLVFV